jgi:hypothetical protein
MEPHSLEQLKCIRYLQLAEDEQPLEEYLQRLTSPVSLIVTEGFEERSLGILTKFATCSRKPSTLVVSRYALNLDLNRKYRDRFDSLVRTLSPSNYSIVENRNDGSWLNEALFRTDTEDVIVDITGMSNRSLFAALDRSVQSNRRVFLAYSEPQQYWPKLGDLNELRKELGKSSIEELVDKAEWLFGYEHVVELVEGHEGYDSPGQGRALIGFLPFKSARLAAVLEKESYSEMLFIAGVPRLKENEWRLSAVKEINGILTKDWPVVDLSTFSYRNTVSHLSNLLLSEPGFLQKYDVHLAILGSKLQTIGCWIISSLIRSVTVVTSIPQKYFADSFSEGIGVSWVFELIRPQDVYL